MNMYKKIASFILLSSLSLPFLQAQTAKDLEPLIQNVYGRSVQLLNGYWHYIADPLDVGYYDYRHQPSPEGFFRDTQVDNATAFKEYDFDMSPVMSVPGDWNTQVDRLFMYEGSVWFKHTFIYKPSGKRVFLYFGAANYLADVYLNGKKAGEHVGGYTPFNFEVTDLIKPGENSLIVRVNNRRLVDGVPSDNFDWGNYGGIIRDVMLVELPSSYIQTYSVHLKKGNRNLIEASVKLSDKRSAQNLRIEIPELAINQELTTDTSGAASVEINANPQLWSPDTPKLYDVIIKSSADSVKDEIGFRTIEARGTQILLNGKPIFLKGISIHDEAAYRNGRIYSTEEDRILLDWAKELGCNYVRLAHYPHNEQMVQLAERMGILVWSEVPVYWTINWNNPETYANAQNQLDEMIERDHNRANIIVWSIANETPPGAARNKFLSSLATYARQKDNTRFISMAMERHDKSKTVLSVRDSMSAYVDVISFNEYVGWYDGNNKKIDSVRWEIDYNKPIIISEFGGGALAGNHGDSTQRWTEEYQAALYEKTLKMIDERMAPAISGMSPWILKDFRAPRRLLPQIQDGFLRKGLISDKGQRKEAFYILQKWYKQKKE
jgi:beta-glucuronidase